MDLTRDPLNEEAAAPLRAAVDRIGDGPLALEEALALYTTLDRAGLLPMDLQQRVFGLGKVPAPNVPEAARAVARTRSTIDWESARGRKKRVAIVVPGFLGTTLVSAGWLGSERTSWVSLAGVAGGRITDVRLAADGRTPGANARVCTPSGVMEAILGFVDVYGELAARLSREAHCYLLPYDWRKAPSEQAARLVTAVKELHALHDELPVAIVGHSLGGLLTSVALGEDAEARAIVDRVVIGGTPFLGSFSAPRIFLGTHAALEKVQKADRYNDARRWAEIFASFPGTHALVPSSSGWIAPDQRGIAACRAVDSYRQTKILPWPPHLAAGDELLRRARAGLTVLNGHLGAHLRLLVSSGVLTDAAFRKGAAGWEVTTDGDADGDGTVLRESAEGPGSGAAVVRLVGIEHATMFAQEEAIRAALVGTDLEAPPGLLRRQEERPRVTGIQAAASIEDAMQLAERTHHLDGARAVRVSLTLARALSLLARQDAAGALLAAETVAAAVAAGPW